MSGTDKQSTALAGSLAYIPGLDGVRALAVLAVLLYHAEVPWLPGGFLGVDVFFVLSGYLITLLLDAEWRAHGRIDLIGFWLRRARRLLPALYFLMVVTLLLALIWLPDEVAALRRDALAALGYVTNWYLLFDQQSYFESIGRPSLLQHLWSLAIEEQFYLLWPLVIGVALRRWRRWRLMLVIVAAGLLSVLLMALLYRPDADPSRLYYGTDTRAGALLFGAALALVWRPDRLGVVARRGEGVLFDVLGGLSLGGLVWITMRLDYARPLLYRGGFAAVALMTLALVMAATYPTASLTRVFLGGRVLGWIGRRSYGMYLWHWPIFMVTRPQLDLSLRGLPLVLLRLALTAVMAEVSFRLVEQPIRTGALVNLHRQLASWPRVRRAWIRAWWVLDAALALVFGALLVVAVSRATDPAPPAYLAVNSIAGSDRLATPTPRFVPAIVGAIQISGLGFQPQTVAGADRAPPAEVRPIVLPEIAPPVTPEAPSTTPTLLPEPTTVPLPSVTPSLEGDLPAAVTATPLPELTAVPLPGGLISAVGDSVMLGAAAQLQTVLGNVQIDAQVSRQVPAVIDVLRWWQANAQLGDTVIIQAGDNGLFSAAQFDEIMQIVGSERRVIVVNVRVPRMWQDLNNAMLAEKAVQYPNVVLVDWQSASADHIEYFWEDGIHLRPPGAQAYVDLIVQHLAAPH